MSNQAAYLDAKASRLRIGPSDLPTPGPNEVVIENKALAINPVDWKIQDWGYAVKSWPAVLGQDLAGIVHSVGADVTRFRPGDRVFAHALALASGANREGAFQAHTAVAQTSVALIPASIGFAQASVLPLAVDTALVGLVRGLGLSVPSLEETRTTATTTNEEGKTIVVWGASSSVGATVVQLAVASGAKVVATAGPANHALVRSLGAVEVLDYRSQTVVEDVVEAVRAAGGSFVGVYDAISTPETFKSSIPIIEKLGGGALSVVLEPPEILPSSVKPYSVFGIGELTHPVWEHYLTKALESGKLKAVPEPLIVGKGLEYLQEGMDLNKKGVSAKKVVVEL